MNNKLITALRTAANALESNTVFYEWREPQSCNCGVLFCALTNRSAADLKPLVPEKLHASDKEPTWTTLAGQYCPIAGMPTNKLFRELMSFGLTQKDIQEMEFLCSKAVLARMRVTWKRTYSYGHFPFRKEHIEEYQAPPTELDHKLKSNVIGYMRAWADLLQEQGALDVVTGEPHEKTVAAH